MDIFCPKCGSKIKNDVGEIYAYINIKVNESKLNGFLIPYIPQIESGVYTFDEVKQLVMNNISEFIKIDFCNSVIYANKGHDCVLDAIRYKVYHEGNEHDGTFQEVRQWLKEQEIKAR